MISIIVTSIDMGLLSACLPTWVVGAKAGGEILVGNAAEDTSEQVISNFEWLLKARPDWRLDIYDAHGMTPLAALYKGYKFAKYNLIAFAHDDFMIHEGGWDERVSKLFSVSYGDVGVVGFKGCKELAVENGRVNICTTGYMSNHDEAEFFGTRISGVTDVAHVDGDFVVVSREFLGRNEFDRLEVENVDNYAEYEAWFSCMAKVSGYKVMCVGVRALHCSWLKGDGHHQRQMIVNETERNECVKQPDKLPQSCIYLANRYKNIFPIKVE